MAAKRRDVTPAPPVSLDLRALPPGESAFDIEVAGPAIGIDAEELDLDGPLRVRLVVHRSEENIDVRGRVRGVAREVCARCARAVVRVFELDLFFLAVERPPGVGEEEVPEDDDLLYHDGRFVDLGDPIRQIVLVSVPMAPLCREECRGLCSECGKDLNDGDCGCERSRPDPRWHVIDEMLKKSGPEGHSDT